jgi:hypothetical protein
LAGSKHFLEVGRRPGSLLSLKSTMRANACNWRSPVDGPFARRVAGGSLAPGQSASPGINVSVDPVGRFATAGISPCRAKRTSTPTT